MSSAGNLTLMPEGIPTRTLEAKLTGGVQSVRCFNHHSRNNNDVSMNLWTSVAGARVRVGCDVRVTDTAVHVCLECSMG